MDLLEFEIDEFTRGVGRRLAADPGYTAVQTIPARPRCWQLCSSPRSATSPGSPAPAAVVLGRSDPKHHESDTKVRRGRITKQGSRLVRWAAVESVKALPTTTVVGQLRDRVAARRGANIGAVAAARRQVEYVFYALRDHQSAPP